MSTEKKADFSGVTAKVDSTAPQVEKADFSGVSATVDSTAEIVGERTYTIEKGDTLSKIAKEQLGHASAWKQIFEANRDVLDDPDRIFPGQVIKLPPADTDTTA
ncbi:LysM peptidoglycan-binding domain-containing protein [Pseudoxanthomonas sp. CF125]|jgi:nucleoid-associated protein YgaU|uniref:LysM peptidoglycan-binding domain-containing protein n=1 Tax=Pseudoxanthomonas sp. CF125 TaxID=1855303 RepID=UPI0008913A52|nr:LysM peptidoglycan-binding domain-containing protein [Pseudoxanthomonas sp. CF125]SDR12975.1 LysM domain-containing protein [Pseudoxanthomonas sp. CF125]